MANQDPYIFRMKRNSDEIYLEKTNNSTQVNFDTTSNTTSESDEKKYYGLYGHSSGPSSAPSGQKPSTNYGANIFTK